MKKLKKLTTVKIKKLTTANAFAKIIFGFVLLYALLGLFGG